MNGPAFRALVELLQGALAEAASAAPSETRALVELVPEVQEYGSSEVEDLLGRGNGWAKRHRLELGAYQETPGGRWHFPLHGIKRFQERKAAEQARAGMRDEASRRTA